MSAESDGGLIGSVQLRLTDAERSVEAAPDGIEIGAIQLRAWQLHRLSPMPPAFADRAGYLVRINYEFDIAAGVPPPAWAEVEFRFTDDVTVVDAVPRKVYERQDDRSYRVTQYLNLTDARSEGWWTDDALASDVALPPAWPRIDCFGPGSSRIRWRHTGSPDPPAGSQAGWFVLLVPPEETVIPVLATGLYMLELDPGLDLVPTSRREAFMVRLPGPAAAPRELRVGTAPRDGRPRVFISYSQETHLPDGGAHRANVERLWRLLEANGVDVLIDQVGLDRRRNWLDWTNAAIQRSDYTIVVASPAYLAASENRLPPGQNRGVRSEYNRLANLLHHDESVWTRKILPVVLPGRSVEEIPHAFLPAIADHYIIKELTTEGISDLLRVIHSHVQ